jgi:predicted P-loop ATPase
MPVCAETVVRISFVAGVARVYEPGCKVDAVPILEGPKRRLAAQPAPRMAA